MRTALIDGDSIAHILGWNLRDETVADAMYYNIDNFIISNLVLLEATHYVGALTSKPVFRDDVYKFAKYKGKRAELDEAIKRWKPIVYEYLVERWKFLTIDHLEADDIVGYLAYREDMGERIVCSPDKDLRQIPGKLYDYHKGIMEEISEQEAVHNLRMQMLCGDVTDNVKGIPGMGDVKATKYLKENPEADAVYKAYIRHFGDYYGTIIHEETLATLEVVRPNHIYASYFENDLNRIQAVPFEDTETNVFLRELD